jgi:phage FluMu protein Com
MAGVMDFIYIWLGIMALLLVGGIVWAMDPNNRTKILKWVTKKNLGIAGIVGKAGQLGVKRINLAEEYFIFRKKVFRIMDKDDKGNPLAVIYNGVPWVFYNEDSVFPLIPMSEKGDNKFYFCKTCNKFREKPEFDSDGTAKCHKCGEVLTIKREILPVNVHKAGTPGSLKGLYSIFKEEAQLEAQGQLLAKLNEFGWMKWAVVAEILLLLVLIGLVWTTMGNVQAIKDHLMPPIINATVNATR